VYRQSVAVEHQRLFHTPILIHLNSKQPDTMHKSIPVLLVILLNIGFVSTAVSSGSKSKDKDALSPAQRADVTYVFFNANKEKILGNLNTAAELFAEVIRKDPKNAAAMYELSRVYADQKKYADALYFSKSAYKISSANVWYALNYADVLQHNNRFKESAEVYEQLIHDHPEEAAYYQELADAFIYAGAYEDGIKAYDRMEDQFGLTGDIAIIKARLYQQIKKPEKAIDALEKWLVEDSTDIEAFGMLAQLYQTSGKSEKALAIFQYILKVDPDNAIVHLSLADYYRTAGDKERSVNELKLAFQNKELDIETKISILGSYYALITDYPELKEQSLDMCKLLVQTHPKDPRSHAVYADFLLQDKKFEEARAQYRKAKELGSKEYSVHSQILYLDSQLQDWDAMLSDSEEALSLFPDQPFVYLFNGLAKHQKKQERDAASVLSSGVKMVVDNVPLETQFYSTLGEIYHELKEYEKSDQSYDKALSLDPKDANAMNNYAYFLSLRKEKLAKAEELSRKSNELEPAQASYEDTYGWIMFTMEKYTDAKTWIGKSLEHGGDKSAAVLEHYGDVMYRLGDVQSAIDYWQRAKAAGEGASPQLDRKLSEKKYVE
jgi:tetratricopeptide (TPR) repeat protein